MSRPEILHYIRGVPVPKIPSFPDKNIEDALDNVPHAGDIIISSYPKTGTTWLQYIVHQILSKGGPLPNFFELTYKVVPYIEMAGIEALNALPKPRVYKHHFAYSVENKDHKSKYLYIHRRPEDVLVSYYYFYQSIVGKTLSIDEFVDDFINGKVWYGNYCDHVLSYLSMKDSDRILLISYENIIADRRKEILRIAKFLGEGYYQNLVDNEDILDRIVEQTGFQYMKKNTAMLQTDIPKKDDSSEDKEITIFRKGIVGDSKTSMSADQLNRLREHAASKMKGSCLEEDWLLK